ncbi:MAG: BspA family leucine-rich repeat surface protein [Proteobacteria bacterium]|nr:MAG: BspA family leucine-rich repeat surface protein [Pseudomonadota bacterium]
MKTSILLLVMWFAPVGCSRLSGPDVGGMMKRTGVERVSSLTPLVEESGDRVSALIAPSNSETFALVAPEGSSVVGSTIKISPGTFNQTTRLLLEAGLNLSETSIATDIGLPLDAVVQSAGMGVVIRPSEAVSLNRPLEITIPLPVGLGLSGNNFAVISKTIDPLTGRLLNAITPVDGAVSSVRFSIEMGRNVVDFKGYFGSYWIVSLSRALSPLEIPVAKVTVESIANKSGTYVITSGGIVDNKVLQSAKSIPVITLPAPTLIFQAKNSKLELRLAETNDLTTCTADVFSLPSDVRGTSYSVGHSFELILPIPSIGDLSFTGRFRCIDSANRMVVSPWSETIRVRIPVDVEVIEDFTPPLNVFKTTWQTDLPGSSAANQIVLPLVGGGIYDFKISWGDGSHAKVTSSADPDILHSYSSPGTYTVQIWGTVNGWSFAGGGDSRKLQDIAQWGPLNIGNQGAAFSGCQNLTISATDKPDLKGVINFGNLFAQTRSLTTVPGIQDWNVSEVESFESMFFESAFDGAIGSWDMKAAKNLSSMFRDNAVFNQPIGDWNLASAENLMAMFLGATKFDQPLNTWNVSHVTNAAGIFFGASEFNQSLDGWDVSSVKDMSFMFCDATRFNGTIDSWDVSRVEDMSYTFTGALVFAGSLKNWETGRVKSMQGLFQTALVFNGEIEDWDVSSVEDMGLMFAYAANFGRDIGSWSVSNVKTMDHMFERANSFNRDLSNWNTSSLTNVSSMFAFNSAFNGSIAGWDVSHVTDFSNLFFYAGAFNSSLATWNVSEGRNMYNMFINATAFNQDISDWNVSSVRYMNNFLYGSAFSTSHYESLLTKWSSLPLQHGVDFSVGSVQYSSAAAIAGRDTLVSSFGWTVHDGGQL